MWLDLVSVLRGELMCVTSRLRQKKVDAWFSTFSTLHSLLWLEWPHRSLSDYVKQNPRSTCLEQCVSEKSIFVVLSHWDLGGYLLQRSLVCPSSQQFPQCNMLFYYSCFCTHLFTTPERPFHLIINPTPTSTLRTSPYVFCQHRMAYKGKSMGFGIC